MGRTDCIRLIIYGDQKFFRASGPRSDQLLHTGHGMGIATRRHWMLIEELSARSESEWDAYIDTHPESTCYHLRAWKEVAQRAYRLRVPFLISREAAGKPICGALPLFSIPGPMQSHLTNGLFGAYGALLADHPRARAALIKRTLEILNEERSSYLLLKFLNERESIRMEGFQHTDAWVIAKMPLDPDPGIVWSGLRDKIRNCVRKAQRHGLEIRSGRSQLEAYYDVLAENMHRKGSPIYGLHFMRELFESLGNRAEIVSLWHQGHPVSGAFLIFHHQTTYVPFASSRPSSFHMSPNNLLYWEIIRMSCLRGMRTLDFGRSLNHTGPLSFKTGWGAHVIPQPCYLYAASGKTPKLDPHDPFVDWFVRQWQRLPRRVADSLGPAICRRWLA